MRPQSLSLAWSGLLALGLTACRTPEPPQPTAPPAQVKIALSDEAGLSFPSTLSYPGGQVALASNKESQFTLAAAGERLVPLELAGFGKLWVEAPSGGAVNISDNPCCGVEVLDPRATEDTYATCAPSERKGCGPGTERLTPGLAADPLCKQAPRCIQSPQIKVVAASGAPATLSLQALHTGETIPQGGEFRPLARNIAKTVVVAVLRPDGSASPAETVALATGARYLVEINPDGISRITRSF